ncbi:MAG: DNA polymerase I [Bacillota bacterium]|nr:DNA polymerase I [Bacillota bacterium]
MASQLRRDERRPGPGLAILDGSSLLHRAYYALPHLTSPQGVVTNAVYGFTMMLLRLLEEQRPERVVVAFDRPAPTFRHEAFAQYKATRKPMPDDLRPQGPLCEELLAAFGIPVVGLEGYEADDLIGTLACRAAAAGLTTLVVTGDRDALQLVSPLVQVVLTRRGITDTELYDLDRVKEQFGLTPTQFIDLKGLMGDASDNIPGVPGIGEKGALRLIQQYGSVEGVLAHADEIGGRTGNLLRTYADQARLSRQLATIECQAPLPLDPAALEPPRPDTGRLRELFTQLGFRNLLKSLPGGAAAAQGSLFGPGAPPPAPPAAPSTPSAPSAPEWVWVDRLEELEEAVRELRGREEFGLAAVLDTPAPWQRTLQGLALVSPERGWFVRLTENGAARPGELECAEIVPRLLPLFAGERPRRVGHDLKAFSLALGTTEGPATGARAGTLVDEAPRYAVRSSDFDVMLASYVLDPTRGNHTLEEVAFNHLGLALPERPKPPKGERTSEEWQAAAACAVQQASACLALRPRLDTELAAAGLTRLFREVEMALVPVLAAMERRGVAVDTVRLETLSRELERRIGHLAAEIYRLAGEEFNLNSPRQLAAILFEKLKLPAGKRTKTGLSTSADVLEELAFDHPIARHLLDHRQLVKLKTTYVDTLPALINPATGRVHTTFNQAVTATGRLSSTNPNLQNIPVRTEEGGKIREAFVAGGEGHVLISADYSQIELRVMAHLSRDPILSEAFRSGEDIHTRTAAEMFGLPPEQVTPEMRSGAKAINFGIIYGISSFGLARGTKISREQAQEFIKAYFARYAKVKAYLDEVVAAAREKGYVTTILGRRRFLPDLHSRNYALRSFAERTAMNTPIQGSAADIIKLAMIACERELAARGLRTRMVLQVHDELVFEGPEEEVPAVARLVREAMETAVSLQVPLVVEVEAGRNWREGEKVPRA